MTAGFARAGLPKWLILSGIFHGVLLAVLVSRQAPPGAAPDPALRVEFSAGDGTGQARGVALNPQVHDGPSVRSVPALDRVTEISPQPVRPGPHKPGPARGAALPGSGLAGSQPGAGAVDPRSHAAGLVPPAAALPPHAAARSRSLDGVGASAHARRAPSAASRELSARARGVLLDLLHREISRHQRYPLLARRQGREGTATVSFSLRPDGALDAVRVAVSSGFVPLDRAAMSAVAQVAPFGAAGRYLSRPERFRVQVVFRLY